MKTFRHVTARSISDAIAWLQSDEEAAAIGGGTDLVPRMKLGVTAPSLIVDLKNIPGLDRIGPANGSLRIGALAKLDDVASSPLVREAHPMLAQAIGLLASPQLRNVGTLAGNLGQYSHCWYYRGHFNCWLKGGETCNALEGQNQKHAIFSGGPCWTAQPSDLAAVMVALDASAEIAGPDGTRVVRASELFQVPTQTSRRLTSIRRDELITAVELPHPHSKSIFIKAMERRVWSFALASVAARLQFEGQVVRQARLVLGGVAAIPWGLPDVNSFLAGKSLDTYVIARAAEMAVSGARPMSKNHYKVQLVKGLVTQALEALRAG